MKLWPVAHFFHSLLESGNIQNIATCHFLYCCKEMTCCNVLYVPRFQKWVKKGGNRSEFHSERNHYLQNWYFTYLWCGFFWHNSWMKFCSYYWVFWLIIAKRCSYKNCSFTFKLLICKILSLFINLLKN